MSTDLSADAAADIAREDEIYQQSAEEGEETEGAVEQGAEPEGGEQEAAADEEASGDEGQGEEGDGEAQEDGEKPAKGTVPHGALHAEREERKKAVDRADAAEARTERLEQTFQKFVDRLPKDDQEKPAEIDFDADPVGGLKAINDKIDAREQKDADERQQTAQENQFFNALNAGEQAFAAETPDYPDAYNFLVSSRDAELQAIGMGPQERRETIGNDIRNIAESNLANGQNPAKVYYELATLRGYAKADPADAEGEKEGAKEDGPDPIKALQKGQKAAQSLGGGGSAKDNLSLEQLSDMDDDAFAENFEKLWGGT